MTGHSPGAGGERRTRRQSALLGRDAELELASAALADALGGRPALLLVAGEGGIGKTRLATEVGARAEQQGATVAWGRAWEAGGAPPYWPWIQALGAALRGTDPSSVGPLDRRVCEELAPLLPELAAPTRKRRAQSDDATAARFRLFEAAARQIEALAAERPLVVALDDLHAADEASVLMLQFVARDLRAGRVLLVATYRPQEARRRPALNAALSDLVRAPHTTYVELQGVDRKAVETWAGDALGHDAVAIASAVHARTEGNPLFAQELIRLIAAGRRPRARGILDEELPLPDVGREILTGRLAALPGETRQLVEVASVLGRDFAVGRLAALAGIETSAAWDAVQPAIAERILEPGPGADALRFGHMLVRDAAYDAMPPVRRAALHQRVAEMLERDADARSGANLAEIAHHYVLGADPGSVDRARDASTRAADQALRSLAYEEAVRLYAVALELHEGTRGHGSEATCDLLLALADAQARAGHEDDARRDFLRAAELAAEMDAPDRLARAALGYGGRFVWGVGRDDPHLRSWLERALARVTDTRTEWEARLLARLAAGPMRADPDAQPRQQLSARAVEIARELEQPAVLAYALDARVAALMRPDTSEQRLEVGAELRDAAQRAGDRERLAQAHLYRFFSALELGNTELARAELRLAQRVADELRQPAQRWLVESARAALALLEGPVDAAERVVTGARELGQHVESWNALATYSLQMYTARLLQGRYAELPEIAAAAVRERPQYHVLRFLLAHGHALAGNLDEARTALEQAIGDRLDRLPFDEEWLFAMNLAGETACLVEDRQLGADVRASLEPYAPMHAVAIPEVSHGSVLRVLGLLARLLGDEEAAAAELERAAASNARAGAEPWRVLAVRALSPATAATGTTSEMHAASAMDAAEATQATFRREGDVWLIEFQGDSFRIRDTKGLQYLARLLAEPSREFHALDLVGLAERREPGPSPSAASPMQVADTALVSLDPEAKRAYRERLAELDEELAEAERWQDAERAARAQSEREFLVQELARAVGLGRRDRPVGSDAERARISVTKAVRAALARMEPHSAVLHRHLEATVRTGVYCSYRPDPRAPISWHT